MNKGNEFDLDRITREESDKRDAKIKETIDKSLVHSWDLLEDSEVRLLKKRYGKNLTLKEILTQTVFFKDITELIKIFGLAVYGFSVINSSEPRDSSNISFIGVTGYIFFSILYDMQERMNGYNSSSKNVPLNPPYSCTERYLFYDLPKLVYNSLRKKLSDITGNNQPSNGA